MTRSLHWMAAGLAGIAALVHGVQAGARTQSAEPVAINNDEAAPPAARDWPVFGGGWMNARYSSPQEITTANVKTLAGAWAMHFAQNASTRGTPVVRSGVMFISAGSGLDASDAKPGPRKGVWQ